MTVPGPAPTAPIRPLAVLLRENAERIGDATAFSDARTSVGHAELERRTGRLAGHLAGLGLRRGDRVAVHMDDCVEAVESCLAAIRAGAVGVPLDPRATEGELRHLLEDSGAAVVVTDPPRLERVRRALPARHRPTVLVTGAPSADATSYEELATTAPPRPPRDDLGLDEPAWMIYTSGTTGRPKGVLSTQRNRLWPVAACLTGILGLDGRDRLLWPLPMSHSFSHTVCLHGVVATGASAMILGGFDAARVLAEVRARRISVLAGVPVMYHRLLAAAGPGGFGAGHAVRLCLYGGGVAPPPLHRAFRTAFGLPLVGGYGCTETSGPVAMNPPTGPRRPGAAGPPVPGVTVRIADPVTGLTAGTGERGEVWVRGPGIMVGYHGRPAETRRRIRAGWYRTGDLGRLDENGHLTVEGRLDDLIRSGGESIVPAEVEEVLLAVPGIADAAVTGEPHPALGQVPVAYVVAGADGVDADRLRAACRERLSPFKIPDEFHEVAEIPRTGIGKVDRTALAEERVPRARRPEPDSVRRPRPDLGTCYTAPASPAEREIAAIWAELLGFDRVGADDHFLELGGTSLLAARCAARLAEATGAALPPGAVYAAPTVRSLARLAETSTAKATGPAPPADRTPSDAPHTLPLAPAQAVFWYLDHYRRPGSAAHPDFALTARYRVTGDVDADALRTAVARLAERHEALRTRVLLGAAEGRQVVLGTAPEAFAHHHVGAGEAATDAWERARRPLDAAAGRVLTVDLLSSSGGEHLLVVRVHHMVADAWSMNVIVRELAALYSAALRGRTDALAPAPSYRELVRHIDETFFVDTRWRDTEPYRSALRHWERQAAGAAPIVLGGRCPAGDRPTESAGVLLPPDAAAALAETARRNRATVFAALFAALARLLAADGGDPDVRLLTLSAGRETPEASRTVGMLLNPLLLRMRAPADRTYAELVRSASAVVQDALTHGQVPVLALCEEIPELLAMLTESQLVVFETLPEPAEPALDGCTVQRLDPPDARQRFPVDLLLTARPEGRALLLAARYDPDVVDRGRVLRLLDGLRHLVP